MPASTESSFASHPAIERVESGESDTLSLYEIDPDRRLTELPDVIRTLTGLSVLHLGSSPIVRLPAWLTELPNLREIGAGQGLLAVPPLPDVRWNVSADVMWRCSETLDPRAVYRVYIDDESTPEAVRHLVRLAQDRTIALSDLGIYGNWRVPDDRVTPTQESPGVELALRELGSILSGQPLKSLAVNWLHLAKVPEPLRGLATLEDLDLWRSGLRAIPEWVFTLPALRSLELRHNELIGLPDSVGNARLLRTLDLGHNPMPRVPEGIWRLNALESLDLTGCPVTEIPADVLDLRSLTNLEVNGNDVIVPPPEVAVRGLEAIKNYWLQRQDVGVDLLTEAKLLIVGEPGAGKTSLAKKIRDREYTLEPTEVSTEGIDVLPWHFPSAVRISRDGQDEVVSRDFRVNIWDFGGQEIYHATHQFFLTKRSTYVLVTDDRKEDTDLDYWLEVVDLLSGGSPLLIVQNCKQGRRRALDLGGLRRRYPNLRGPLSLDLADNSGLDDAVTQIRSELERLPHIGTPLPKTWRDVRVTLEADPRDHITADEFLRVCEANGFTRREDMHQLGGFLHDLGICLFFQDDALLRRTVILKPQWGTRAVYRVLDDQPIIDALGVFTADDLTRVWHEPGYADMRGELLQLMTRFALCYPVSGSTYIAPQLLTPTQPDYPWDDGDDLTLRYVYDVMPKGIVRRVIVALHDLIEPGHVWRTGAVFAAKGSRVEVVEEYHRRQLLIRLTGEDPRILLDRVDRALDVIHRSYPDIRLTRYRPCDCPACQESAEPEMFSVDDLRRFAEAGHQIQCRRSMQLVSPAELLADLVPGQRPVRRPVPSAPEVFVSYKWGGQSEALVDEIVATLAERGVQVVRDRDEMTYRDSIRAFMQRLGAGKAIVVVIDQAYLESANCMFELTEIAGNKDLASRVFPIVMPDAGIYEPRQRLRYVKHWDAMRTELDHEMRDVGLENLQGIREDLDLYETFRNTIAGITHVLKDMNTLTPEMHRRSGFTQLYDALSATLDPR
jgi:hypothetical protein